MLIPAVLMLLAALSNAVSNVLQRKANSEEPPELSLSPRLIGELIHRRVWLAGVGAITVSFLLQAAALTHGDLSSVQPIVVLELPLTFVAARLFFRKGLGRRDWLAIVGITVGLAVLIAFMNPSGGRHHVGAARWGVGLAVTVGATSAVVAVARLRHDASRALLLGCASGLTFGLTAALMKGMTGHLHHGLLSVLGAWQTYAMILAGLTGEFLTQSAFNSGRLIAAQPGITVLDPFTAIVWGLLVFGERPQGGVDAVVAVLGGVLMAASAVALATSPALEEVHRPEGEEPLRAAA